MKIYSAIAIHRNHFHFLMQVIDGALREDISKIIVVDNNPEVESREKLRIYEQELGVKYA